METVRYYAENSSMKQSAWLIGINMLFCNCKITILGCNRKYHTIFDKLNSDTCSYVIFVLCRFWMLNFSHASGKYCIWKATVGSTQYCKMQELHRTCWVPYICFIINVSIHIHSYNLGWLKQLGIECLAKWQNILGLALLAGRAQTHSLRITGSSCFSLDELQLSWVWTSLHVGCNTDEYQMWRCLIYGEQPIQ